MHMTDTYPDNVRVSVGYNHVVHMFFLTQTTVKLFELLMSGARDDNLKTAPVPAVSEAMSVAF